MPAKAPETRQPYAITRTVDLQFEQALARVTELLAAEGFGILTTIDVQATLREKLGLELERYQILGACNPTLASAGLVLEPDLGVLLPCNVVVREAQGQVHVAAMEPVAALALAGNAALEPLAADARARLQRVVAAL